MSNSGSCPPSGNNGGWWSRMSRSEQTMAAIAGAIVAGIFAVIVALIGHSSGSSEDPQAGQTISVAKSQSQRPFAPGWRPSADAGVVSTLSHFHEFRK